MPYLDAPNGIVARGIYDLRTTGGRPTLVLSLGRTSRPAALGEPGEDGMEVTFVRVDPDKPPADDPLRLEQDRRDDERQRALYEFRLAQVLVERHRVQAERAQQEVERATANLAAARTMLAEAEARVANAEKAVVGLRPQPKLAPAGPGEPVVSVHVRTPTAAERVVRVKAADGLTVRDVLPAAELGPDPPVTVWVVRDKKVLAVDHAAIAKNAADKTNHPLKGGDAVFIQVNVGK